MRCHDIITILPSGVCDIMSLSDDLLDEYLTNTKLCNTKIGPLYNTDDIELGGLYYIYCKTSNINECVNIPLTSFIKESFDDMIVNGQCYVIKKYENEITNVNKNDINIVLQILKNNNQDYNLGVKLYDTLISNENINNINEVSYMTLLKYFICL